MAEPFLDHSYIASGFDQMECGGVAEDMRCDLLVRLVWAFFSGLLSMELYPPADSKAGDGLPFVVEEVVIGVDAGVFPCLQVGLDELGGYFPEGDGAGFASFAGEGDGCGLFEAQVANAQIGDFLYARPGVVEQLDEGFVPKSDERGGIDGVEDGMDLFDGEAGWRLVVGLFGSDGLDTLIWPIDVIKPQAADLHPANAVGGQQTDDRRIAHSFRRAPVDAAAQPFNALVGQTTGNHPELPAFSYRNQLRKIPLNSGGPMCKAQKGSEQALHSCQGTRAVCPGIILKKIAD